MNALLVVEDLPDIRAWLVDTARIAFPDSEVVAVGRCREGLGEAVARRFDVALIDLELPDGSGVAVIQALRTHQPQAMSVVLTIHDDDDHLFPALQAGAFGYLLKEQPQETLVSQLLRMMQGEPPPRSYQHVAFKIAAAEFDAACACVAAAGLEIRPGRPRVEGEARSLYFYSPEGHLFELHTGALDERLARYAGGSA